MPVKSMGNVALVTSLAPGEATHATDEMLFAFPVTPGIFPATVNTPELFFVTVIDVGAPGLLRGAIASDEGLFPDSFTLLSAVHVNVYSVPLASFPAAYVTKALPL